MNIVLMLHIGFAALCLILVPVLYMLARTQSVRHSIVVSAASSVGLLTTGGALLAQSSSIELPLFCAQTSSLFLAMYVSYVLGERAYRKQTSEQ